MFDLRLAGPLLEESADLQQVVETFREERGIDAILIADARTVSSDPTIRISIPPELRDLAGRGQLGYDRVVVGDTPTLIVGGPTPDRDAELYFLFPEGRISDDLRQLGIALVDRLGRDRGDRVRVRARHSRSHRDPRRGGGVEQALHHGCLARAQNAGRRAGVRGGDPGGAPGPDAARRTPSGGAPRRRRRTPSPAGRGPDQPRLTGRGPRGGPRRTVRSGDARRRDDPQQGVGTDGSNSGPSRSP